MSTTASPLAPAAFPEMPPIAGVELAAHNTGLRYKNRSDLLVVRLAAGTTAAGVFTKSKTRSAPVDWCRAALKASDGQGRGLVVNAGNANAFTGSHGIASVQRTAASAAKALGCAETEVYIASTGTIGVTLDDSKISAVLETVSDSLGKATWEQAAGAIMTTDTYAKGATATAEIDGVPVTICGIAKGSGMIAPDMATMLSYVFTDAALPADVLQELLAKGVDKSFNAITVDGDTSTSDTLMLFATGQAGNGPIMKASDAKLKAFKTALLAVLQDLAHQVVKDGEGATKFVTVTVSGAKSNKAAKTIALSIANSPLVKTAVAGADANWGRVVMAVGKSGEEADRDLLEIRMGGHVIAAAGMAVHDYDEGPVAAHMKGESVDIEVELNLGKGKATVWTCDLTHGYISINADYRS
ncbi:bifunctional glutamate N-acetyltransferase/amino-acid acetyltransferase ArgJ [Rhodospirillum sp. A1_3_36]|uniref:bifunctional glutamate N-acetyltransferase/amino-acid acetyltransferase ArgJ n=1 Tax=Rhodospirillum sp. A1_3_36 TaxID=3391666 RepID=UPI0039A6781F